MRKLFSINHFCKQHIYRMLTLVVLATFLTQAAGAQTSNSNPFPKFELFGGYLAAGEAPYNNFNFGNFSLQNDFGSRHGFELSFARNLNTHLGIKGDFSFQPNHDGFSVNACSQTPCTPVVQAAELNPKLFNYLAGPEVKLGNRNWRFGPFTHALFGLAHTTATFKTSGAAVNLSRTITETGFSSAFGGGFDVRIMPRFRLRTSVDFNPKWVGRADDGSRQVQKDMRLAIGLLFH